MNKKILGILVMALLIGTAIIPIASSMTIRKTLSPGVIDQEQPDASEFDFLENGKIHYQQFINQGKTIEEIEVHIGHYYAGSEPMTLSIQKPLGTTLTSKTLTTVDIPDHIENWCKFDLPDTPLTRGDLYYIVIEFDIGSEYAWSGAHGDPYPSGVSSHPDADWDYAFRTIVDKSKSKGSIEVDNEWSNPFSDCISRNKAINTPFLKFLENYPHLFPLLRQLLGLQ